MHAWRIEIFVHAATGVHAVKTADHVMVDHVHHRLGHCCIDVFEGINAFLHQHVRDLQPFLHHGHLVALFAIQTRDFAGILDCHDAHTISPGISFDDDKGIMFHAIFGIFNAHLLQNLIHLCRETFFTDAFLKIDLAACRKIGIDEPRINIEKTGKIVRHVVIGRKVPGFASGIPAGRQWRENRLLEILQDIRHAC